MYIPASFEMSDPDAIAAFLRAHGFATLVTTGPTGLFATHLPLLFDAGAGPRGVLLGHVARANPQWAGLDGEALAIFGGPHAYISPTWYETPGTVPTWNYVAVHVYGTVEIVEGRDALHEILTRTVAAYEGRMPAPWSYDVNDPDIDRMLRAIVGFRIAIRRWEGKAKLGQNHPEERRRKVIRALEARPESDADARAIARLMAATLES